MTELVTLTKEWILVSEQPCLITLETTAKVFIRIGEGTEGYHSLSRSKGLASIEINIEAPIFAKTGSMRRRSLIGVTKY